MHRDYRIDPFTVEVIRHKLDGIASEMELTLVRSAFSNIVKEALDASASLFTVRGETLAQAIANPAHLAMLYPMVQVLLRTYPIETMSEGDAYILNDPYDGGSHLPDIVIIMPVMFKGRPIAISTALAHHQDIGGMVPGSMPTNATSIFQEGIRIPPLKLRDKGSFNETLLSMLKRNVRLPDVLIGDLNAEIAACTIGVRRLNELAETYGANELLVVFDELLDRAETLTRQALLSIPDGTYHYEDFLDNDGVELDKRVRISVNVTIEGSTMTCDFTGTSVQVKGPINCVPSGSYAAACFAVRAIAGPDIPNNGGCYRPLQFKLPRGSLVDPVEPAPVGCRAAALKRIAGCILGALRQALPERVPADSGHELLILHFGGHRSNGKLYVAVQLLVSGTGASHRSDGVDVLETDLSNCMNVPTEALEVEAPIRVVRSSLRSDSGGPGQYRGGLGCVQEYEVLEDDVTFTYRGERHIHAAAGTNGGMAGACARGTIHRRDGTVEHIPSKLVTVLNNGDRVIVETAGGGGNGPPGRRAPRLLDADLRNAKVSMESVRTIYGFEPSAGAEGSAVAER
jgi:N-methylhydantoinase B